MGTSDDDEEVVADVRVVDDDLDGFARHIVEDDNPTPSFMRGVAQTGPKGVIADYKEYQRQILEQRQARKDTLWRDAAKLSLQSQAGFRGCLFFLSMHQEPQRKVTAFIYYCHRRSKCTGERQ